MKLLYLFLVVFLAFSCGNPSIANQSKKEDAFQIKVGAYNVELADILLNLD